MFLQPSVHCLVSLIETPFFVLTLKEIEICNFERVSVSIERRGEGKSGEECRSKTR